MNKQRKICKYKNEITGWQCLHEALEDSKEGFCIFHERRKDKDIKKFNEGIKKILEDNKLDAYHFEGFFFPSSIRFSGFEFRKDVLFREAVFVGEVTDFHGARFSGKHNDFIQAEFSGQNTDFSEAQFTGHTVFINTKFLGGSTLFIGTKFSGGFTCFSGAEFSGNFSSFGDAEFLGEDTDFVSTKFSAEYCDFWGAKLLGLEVEFSRLRELKWVRFKQTIFKAKTNFIGVDLRKCAFTETDLRNVDFSLLVWDWKHKLANETEKRVFDEKNKEFYFKTSEIYRQLKVQFHNKRDFAKAGMFHFREQECKRKACKLPKDFFKWIFLWILRLSCGYGEKLRNVGLSSLALVLIFGIIYMFLGLHNTDQNESLLFQYSLNAFSTTSLSTILKDFWTSLVFSIKGFFPLWRFQQYKVVGDVANLVAGIEFLLGAFMVGLFVYVFRRRMDK